jgi:hypothetical protein
VRAGQGLIQGGGAQLDNAEVLCQLTTAISAQNKAATKSKDLHRNKIQRQLTRDKNKKDNTKDQHQTTKTKSYQPPSNAFTTAKMTEWPNTT